MTLSSGSSCGSCVNNCATKAVSLTLLEVTQMARTCKCLGIDTDVQLVPLAPTFCAMLFALPFALTQEFGPCGVEPQFQPARAGSTRHLHIQVVPGAAKRAGPIPVQGTKVVKL